MRYPASELLRGDAQGAEPEPRYFLAGRTIGLPSLRLYGRTLVGMGLWLGAPALLASFLGRRNARDALHRLERLWARRAAQYLHIRLDIRGLEHIDPHTRYVVTPLHESFADVIALLLLPLNLRFVARDELFTWRCLGPYLRSTGQIMVSPEQGSRAYRRLLRAAGDIFAAGESLVIFPQGTILGIETDFMPGAFALARATGRPILPVALTGGHCVWEHPYTARLRYGQRISLRILHPIGPEAFAAQDVDAVRRDVQRRLKAAALDGTMAPPRRFVPERDGYWDGYSYRIDPEFEELATKVARRRMGDQ